MRVFFLMIKNLDLASEWAGFDRYGLIGSNDGDNEKKRAERS